MQLPSTNIRAVYAREKSRVSYIANIPYKYVEIWQLCLGLATRLLRLSLAFV